MTDTNDEEDEQALRGPVAQPGDPEHLDQFDSHVIEVRRYDTDDTLLATQYFVSIVDTESGSCITSNVSSSTEPAVEK